jgi:hypothetical protein
VRYFFGLRRRLPNAVEELRQVFLFIAGWYHRGLHQKPHTLFLVALIEIKTGDMVRLAQGLALRRAGEITPLQVNYPDYAAALAHSQLMVWGAFPPSLNPKPFLNFETELFCGRYDSTNFDGERDLSKSWPYQPLHG